MMSRHGEEIRVEGQRSGGALPDCVGDAAALLPAVGGQAAHQVRRLQAAAENRPDGAEQQQLAVIRRRVAQRPAHFLHDLWRRGRWVGMLVCDPRLLVPDPSPPTPPPPDGLLNPNPGLT